MTSLNIPATSLRGMSFPSVPLETSSARWGGPGFFTSQTVALPAQTGYRTDFLGVSLPGNLSVGPELSLADTFSTYPSQRDPEFQRLYALKLEFAELKSRQNEPTPKLGQFYPYQRQIGRFFMHYDRAFNISDAGTGKARMFIEPAERFKHLFEELGDAAPVRGALILVANDKLIKDVINQIICSSQDYQGMTYSQAVAKINKWYMINTYRKFVDKEIYNEDLTELRPKEQIIKKYANYFIHIDEAQKVRIESKATGIGGEGSSEAAIQVIRQRERRARDQPKDPDRMYKGLIYFMEIVPGLKRMISSATPMYHSRKELSRVGNLILVPEARLVEDREYTDDEIRKIFNGTVFFIKQINPYVSLVEVGNSKLTTSGQFSLLEQQVAQVPEENSRIIWSSEMIDTQLKIYKSFIEPGKRGTANINLHQISLGVFPNGKFGGSLDDPKSANSHDVGLPDYIYYDKKDNKYKAKEEFLAWFPPHLSPTEKLERLKSFSAIYYTLLSYILARNERKRRGEMFGTMFIFSHILNGPGAILLLVLLEHILGYESYYGEPAFSVSGTQVKSITSECRDAEEMGGEESIAETHVPADTLVEQKGKKPSKPVGKPVLTIPKKLRCALLPRNDNKFNSILKVNNSAPNWNGEYLDILIATPQAGIGINVANATEFHTTTADPNDKGTYQEIMRIVRANSFDYILQQGAVKEKKIQVKIHYHATVAGGLESDNISTILNAMVEGVKMEKAYVALKSVAFNGHVDLERNQGITTESNTLVPSEAALSARQQIIPLVTKMDQKELGSDTSTYYINYANQEIARIHDFMRQRFRFQYSIDVSSILTKFPGMPKIVIERALQQVTDEKFQVRNGMCASARVFEENDVYFLSEEVTEQDAKLADLNYVNAFSANSSIDFVEWVNKQVNNLNSMNIRSLFDADIKTIEQTTEMNKSLINVTTLANLVETGIEQILRGQKLNNLQAWVFLEYSLYIHRLVDPKTPGRIRFLHRIDNLQAPILKQGHASRVLALRTQNKNMVFDSFTEVNAEGQTYVKGNWRLFTRHDSEIKKLVKRDIEDQIGWYTSRGITFVMMRFKNDYRRTKLENGKAVQSILLKDLDAKEKYDILYELGVPPRSDKDPNGYFEDPKYTFDYVKTVYAQGPDAYWRYLQDTLSRIRPRISNAAYATVEQDVLQRNDVRSLLFYANLSSNNNLNKGSHVIGLIQNYMIKRGRLLQRHTNMDWYLSAISPEVISQYFSS